MFWGVILESGKRYSQTVEQSYHLTMASLEPPADGKTPSKYVSLMIEHEKAEYMLCTLEHERNLQVHLDHMFVEGEEVTYFLNGDGTVHLTGYVIGDDQFDDFDEEDEEMDDEESDDDDEDQDEHIPKLNKIPIGKRKTETSEPFGKKMKVEAQKDIRRETSPIKGAKPEEKSVNAKVKDERSLSPVKGNIKVENVKVKNAKDESDDDSDEDDDDDDEEEDEEEASEGDLGLIDKEAVEAEESDDNDEESDDNDEEESDESDDSDNDDKTDNKEKKTETAKCGNLKTE